MDKKKSKRFSRRNGNRVKYSLKMTTALICLSLIMSGPNVGLLFNSSLGTKTVAAQASGSSDTATDDTPSAQDIADFQAEYDQDGDGEVDEPDDEEADEPADEPDEADDADQEDDYDDEQDDYRDDDHDGQENFDDDDESGDSADTREDVDSDANPDYRISGFNRYASDKKLRRLGAFDGLTPLIEREEQLLFEN